MSTRTEFNDEDIPPVLSRLIAEGRLRDYVLIELYASAPLSFERLVQMRVGELHMQAGMTDVLSIEHRGISRVIHLDSDGLFAIKAWIKLAELDPADYLFPSMKSTHGHLCSRQARRIIDSQFHRAQEGERTGHENWKQQLGNEFRCRLSRWPWVECVRAQSGSRCTTHCEGMATHESRRPFRVRGVLKPPPHREM